MMWVTDPLVSALDRSYVKTAEADQFMIKPNRANFSFNKI
jgi:hypothetical protein